MQNYTIDESNVELVFETKGSPAHFFGYYGLSPWSGNQDKLLCHRTNCSNDYIGQTDHVDICYIDLSTKLIHCVAKTGACNWQQGSFLQWAPPDHDERIIFNDRLNDSFCSKVMNIDTGKSIIYERPISAVHPNGKIALGLNMERIYYTRRAYSYEGNFSKLWREPVIDDDGIYELDFRGGRSRLLIKTRDLFKIDPKDNMKGALHWLDHPLFSPRGDRFAFFHRWQLKTGNFFTRLYTVNTDGSNLHLYPDSGMYSHAAWRSDDELLIFAREGNADIRYSDMSLLKRVVLGVATPIYRRFSGMRLVRAFRNRVLNDRYLLFRVNDNGIRYVMPQVLTSDGHPCFSPKDRNVFVTDTYPDNEQYRNLYVCNIEEGTCSRIGRFKSPENHTDSSSARCDLHPRWDRRGECVCVDSLHGETRQMLLLRIKRHSPN